MVELILLSPVTTKARALLKNKWVGSSFPGGNWKSQQPGQRKARPSPVVPGPAGKIDHFSSLLCPFYLKQSS
jgi:hypothetical protein